MFFILGWRVKALTRPDALRLAFRTPVEEGVSWLHKLSPWTESSGIARVHTHTNNTLKSDLFLFYVHWCLDCMYVWVRVLDLLEQELTNSSELLSGCWELNAGPLEEQPELSHAEPSLQPLLWLYTRKVPPTLYICRSGLLYSGEKVRLKCLILRVFFKFVPKT